MVYFSSSKIHLPRSFAVLNIHVMLIWLPLSVKFSVSSSTSLRNSLTSSSHPFLGLPTALLVLYFELSSGFHSAAFINHLSLGDVAILITSLHFIFCESCFSIESSHFPSFLWHRLFFFLSSRSNLLLHSLLYQFLLQYRSRMTGRCPGHCERLSFIRLRSRHQCYSSHRCLCLRWSCLFVSRCSLAWRILTVFGEAVVIYPNCRTTACSWDAGARRS